MMAATDENDSDDHDDSNDDDVISGEGPSGRHCSAYLPHPEPDLPWDLAPFLRGSSEESVQAEPPRFACLQRIWSPGTVNGCRSAAPYLIPASKGTATSSRDVKATTATLSMYTCKSSGDQVQQGSPKHQRCISVYKHRESRVGTGRIQRVSSPAESKGTNPQHYVAQQPPARGEGGRSSCLGIKGSPDKSPLMSRTYTDLTGRSGIDGPIQELQRAQ